jgi:hypothetical protein
VLVETVSISCRCPSLPRVALQLNRTHYRIEGMRGWHTHIGGSITLDDAEGMLILSDAFVTSPKIATGIVARVACKTKRGSMEAYGHELAASGSVKASM